MLLLSDCLFYDYGKSEFFILFAFSLYFRDRVILVGDKRNEYSVKSRYRRFDPSLTIHDFVKLVSEILSVSFV